MPVNLIEESARKPRRVMQGKFAEVPEVQELWRTLTKLPQGKAVEVSIPTHTINEFKKDKVENPVRSIVNACRRKMKSEDLPFEIYANDESSFTVIRERAEKNGKGKK